MDSKIGKNQLIQTKSFSDLIRFHNMGKEQDKIKNLLSRERKFWDNESKSQQNGLFETFTSISYKRILEYFQIPSNSFGLEYACGSGAFSNFISSSRIVGLDISFNLLRSSKSVIPVQGNGEELPFKKQSFDFVLCAAALHHIRRLNQALAEIARVIKPGGYLYIFELNTNHPQRKLVSTRQSGFRKIFRGTNFSPTEVLISEKRLLIELSQAGLTLESKYYVSPVYRHPTRLAKVQTIISRYFAKGIFKKYLESYILIRAQKSLSAKIL